MTNLNKKTILITGAGSGIGLATTKKALKQGAKVSAFTRRMTDELKDLTCDHLYIHTGDVSNEQDIESWVVESTNIFGGFDVLFNNAGSMYYMKLENPNYSQMKNMVETNCLGLINLIQHALPVLCKSETPHWINTSSDAGREPFPGLAVYSGTKAFVEFTTKAMRMELINKGVKVTNIQPGNVATNLHNKSTEKDSIQAFATENVGQYLRPDDVVNAIMFAISTPHDVAVNEILIEPLTESIVT